MRLLVQAPVRIGLFGGGTDISSYSDFYGGICINMAINIRQEFTFYTEGAGLVIPPNASTSFYKSFLKEFELDLLIEQNFDGFIHGGLGSSASAAVCLVSGLSKLKGQELTRYEIAEKAWDIEVNKIGLFGGKQDQYCATFGGFNLMKFGNKVELQSIHRGVAENVADHLLLFDTGIRRTEPKLQENLRTINEEQKQALDMIKQIANDAYHRIYRGNIKGLGELLDTTWQFKKKSNKVTNPQIDGIYNKAIGLGAYGGKLNGSGGGGAMTFIAPQDKHKEIIAKMQKIGCRWIDFGGIDWTGVVTRFL